MLGDTSGAVPQKKASQEEGNLCTRNTYAFHCIYLQQ